MHYSGKEFYRVQRQRLYLRERHPAYINISKYILKHLYLLKYFT